MTDLLSKEEIYLEENKELLIKQLDELQSHARVAALHPEIEMWQKLSAWASRKWGYIAQWHYKNKGRVPITKPKVNKKVPNFSMDDQIDRFTERQRVMKARSYVQERVVIEVPAVWSVWIGQGDLHLFGEGTDMQRFRDDTELIRDTPGTYIFSLGDMIDNGGNITRSKRGRKDDDTSEIQHAGVDYYLDMVGDKIMAMVVGNHDEWSHESDGRSYGEEWAKKIAGGFLGFEGIAEIRFCDVDSGRVTATYNNWITHSAKGYSMYNPTHGGNRVLMDRNPNVDAVWWGHIHNTATASKTKGDLTDVTFIRGGGYQMDARYAKAGGYQRASIKIPGVVFDPLQKDMSMASNFGILIRQMEDMNSIYTKKEITDIKITKEPKVV